MFKNCVTCGMPATLILNDQMYCSQHAFDKIVKSEGPLKADKIRKR